MSKFPTVEQHFHLWILNPVVVIHKTMLCYHGSFLLFFLGIFMMQVSSEPNEFCIKKTDSVKQKSKYIKQWQICKYVNNVMRQQINYILCYYNNYKAFTNRNKLYILFNAMQCNFWHPSLIDTAWFKWCNLNFEV